MKCKKSDVVRFVIVLLFSCRLVTLAGISVGNSVNSPELLLYVTVVVTVIVQYSIQYKVICSILRKGNVFNDTPWWGAGP